MKIAVIGSRGLEIDNLGEYLPVGVTEIVSGGARGIDQCAARYAGMHHIILKEFLPDYRRFGRGAPLRRNREIVDYADAVIAFWDGNSRGTADSIRYCREIGKELRIVLIKNKREDLQSSLSESDRRYTPRRT